MRKLITIFAAMFIAASAFAASKNYGLKSPDGRLEVNVNVENEITYTLRHD